MEAIREIITNMVIHRDYRSASDSIVKVYGDRIEFYNPGRLPDSISVEDLLSNNYKSTPRNKLIADFCKSIGLIEKYGSGIRRIIEYFTVAQLPRPEFRNISDGFMVTVFATTTDKAILEKSGQIGGQTGGQTGGRTNENIHLTDAQIAVLNIIKLNNKASRNEIASTLKISPSAVQKHIEKLKLKNVIERVGSDFGGYWLIKTQR